MHQLWDEVVQDVIGDTETHQWMHRVLLKSGAKQVRCNKELRNMRSVYMTELRYWKNALKAYKSKVNII